EVRTHELDAILRYARREPACLMQTLRRALGDHEAAACGRCDSCMAEPGADRDDSVDPELEARAAAWLETRALPLSASRFPKLSEGLALLDGPLRGPTYAAFMRARTHAPMLSP